jgi:hypothetical protein
VYAIYHGPLDLSEVLRREHLIADIFRTHNPKGHTGGESNRKWNRTTIVVVCNKATKKTAGAANLFAILNLTYMQRLHPT